MDGFKTPTSTTGDIQYGFKIGKSDIDIIFLHDVARYL